MIADMPIKLPLYCYCETSRHGKRRYYFRRGKGRRVRLPDIGTQEFWPAYQSAIGGIATSTPRKKTKSGTLEWLVERYMETSGWRELSPATRKQRGNIYRQVVEKSGQVQFSAIDRAAIIRGREKRAATPAQSRHFLDAMRVLFRWALEAALIEADPTAGVKTPKQSTGQGFAAWTEDDVATYRAAWPLGTKERVWLEVLLNTGLRRGDAVRLGRQHVKFGEATLTTEKTGTEVTIPLLDDFWTAAEAGQTGDLAYICGANGRPLTKESFGNLFRAACNKAGVKKSAHGLRKLAAIRVAEAGASVAELESLFGWKGGRMASHYTETANRKRLARQAAERLQNAKNPHLGGGAPHLQKKQ